jgi:hypothetical protein
MVILPERRGHTGIQKRRLCEDGGRYWSPVDTNQGISGPADLKTIEMDSTLGLSVGAQPR